ncbi:MAG: gliding motility-associated C-terminal domain-containing protein, partial [Kaistella sp.]|nr:gliding motility-associated C-terminal domain-containing protein [Kaistella sp.]
MKKFLFIFTIIFSQFAFGQSDCISAIPVCGNSNVSYTPSGIGLIDEELGGCMGSDERMTVWYTFTVGTSGTLAFTITPNDFTDDYDFAVYGPNVPCSQVGTATGQPIRCNYSGLDGPTGLSLTVVHPTVAAQWSGFLNVIAGETYILVVDNFSQSTNGFTLQWSGTATLNSPFNDPTIQPNPFLAPGPANDGVITVCTNPAIFDFSTLSAGIINGNPNFTVNYYATANNALTGTAPILTPISVNTANTYHYTISYTDPTNPANPINSCKNFGTITFVQGAIVVNNATVRACNNNNSGTGVFDLTSVSNAMFADPTATRVYYRTIADMDNG